MILKVIKTYEKAKNCLCVAIIEHEIAVLESAPAFLKISKQVNVGDLITLPVDAIIVTQQPKDSEGNYLVTDQGEIVTYNYWKLGA